MALQLKVATDPGIDALQRTASFAMPLPSTGVLWQRRKGAKPVLIDPDPYDAPFCILANAAAPMALLTPGTHFTGVGHRTVKLLRAAFSLQSAIRHLPNLAGLRAFAVQLPRLFLPHAPNIYRRCHPTSVKYLAQRVGVQALVGNETFAALCRFAFEHAAHQFPAFADFILVRRFQGKPNRQLIMHISQQMQLIQSLPKIR